MIYLDNAATTSPKPQMVIQAVDYAVRRYSANPGRGGHRASVEAAEQVYRTRKIVKEFFDLKDESDAVFTQNCTMALNTVIKGVLRKGDHVIISSMEHNAVLRAVEHLKSSGVISYSVSEVKDNDDETVNSFREQINSHTKMIICTHASNVFGKILPVSKLCALAHSYGILFCMDAAQSAGILDVDIAESGYDFVCCAGHKGLYGPMGTGLLLINNEDALPDPLIDGGTGGDSLNTAMPDYLPDRLESGTLNVPGICGLGVGIRFVQSHGVDNIYHKEMNLIRYAYNGLNKIQGVRLYTGYPNDGEYVPVLSFSIEGKDSERCAEFLNKYYSTAVRAGLHCAPLAHKHMGTTDTGTVRISTGYHNTLNDIQNMLNGVNKFVRLT